MIYPYGCPFRVRPFPLPQRRNSPCGAGRWRAAEMVSLRGRVGGASRTRSGRFGPISPTMV
jgi:hypothetical protein